VWSSLVMKAAPQWRMIVRIDLPWQAGRLAM
jgi:hypothetical protein